ncbi:unnamed protein product [Psylliodes chrysocephalus]|uniref:Uncharacterized protein n=1 Tax=Psylliodes chrysocephalus TaxID=3402493 RepID=A0A9P0G706_9CUCU|nr:unnamed protein product [Psylliodes chrysocephala]
MEEGVFLLCNGGLLCDKPTVSNFFISFSSVKLNYYDTDNETKCRLKCAANISGETHRNFFTEYWNLSNIHFQRTFLNSCLSEINPRYRNYINSISRLESHYCRSNSKKKYIEGEKSIADLYRDYAEIQKEAGRLFVKYARYAFIFNREFNIAFHNPKKDQCYFCLGCLNALREKEEKMQMKDQKKI